MRIRSIKTVLCASTCLGLGIAAPVWAQNAAEAVPAETAPVEAAPVAAPAGTAAIAAATDQAGEDAGSAGIGDIIVTAQRREERLRDVPISITALDQEILTDAGVTTTVDLARVTPGIALPFYGAFLLPSIRGISSSGAGLGDSPNVAVYVDGVYQASQSAQLADLPDVQSIQVLKGPQGSLYGQNAAGGAIIIDTVAPSFELGGRLVAGYGNYDDKTINGYVTGPLGPTVAVILSGGYRDRDGVNADVLRGGHDNGLRSRLIRGKVLWKPSSAVSVTLAGHYSQHNDTGIYSNAPLNGNSLGLAIANRPCATGGLACRNLPLATKPHTFAMNPKPDTKIESYGGSLRSNIEIPDIGTISTVTAYDENDIVNTNDIDATPVNTVDFLLHITGRNFIQELNFISEKFGRLTVSAGLFYLNKVERDIPQYTNAYPRSGGFFNTAYPSLSPIGRSGTFSRTRKNSYAGYVELNYDITDQLSLTAAGRYSYEKIRVANIALPAGYQPGDPAVSPLDDPRGAFTFKKFTPRAVLRFKPNPDHTLYASYSQGFKSGFVNQLNINVCRPSPGCIDPPVKPETVDAYEIGYKGKIADVLDLSLAAFHYKYKNIQVYVYNPGPPSSSTYQNAAAGKINGFEFDTAWQATSDLTVRFGGSYLDAKYKKFEAATVYNPSPSGLGNTQSAQDVSGNRLPRTPKWTLVGSLSYKHDTSVGEFGAYIGGNYNSGIYFDPNNRVRQGRYALLDAELSFSPVSLPGLRVALWGKNLTDRDYIQSALESTLVDSGSYGDPRTYGVRVEYKF